MTAYEPDAPIPALHAEPMERLLDALCPDHVVFVLSAHEEGNGWLNSPRIYHALQQSLMEPVQTQVWPLLENAWALAVNLDASADQPDQSLRVHLLRRALAERLEAAWRMENGMEPLLPEAGVQTDLSTEALFPFASGGETLTSDASVLFPPAGLPSSPAPASPSVFTLTPIAPVRAMSDMEDNITELNELLNIIVNKQLHAQFQPIVNLRDGNVFGYEALIRGPKGGMLRRPGALYRAAEKARMVSWFDLACQEQCFARAAQQGLRHHLFINMEAEGLAFMDMHERPLAARARECGLTPASIVIEITERQAVEDYPRLMNALERLREQGFKIAVDDAGAGYNSLQAIAELRPDFVKIDRALVRNLDVNGEHRALLSALVAYARNIGTRILAEGSETREELATLIDLGVTYGQGYLMGKPADGFRGVTKETREFIQARHRQRVQMEAGKGVSVGALARPAKMLSGDTLLADATACFYRNPSLTSVVVVEEGFARGLLMRQAVEHILDMARSARMEGLLPEETVAQWMTTTMQTAGEEETAVDAAREATTRTDLSLEADVVVVDREGRCAGVLPMRVLMEAVTNVQMNRARYADPLTGLPTRVGLEHALEARLEAREPLALARIDLTGLEFYNRTCGLPHGDRVICALASLAQQACRQEAERTPGLPEPLAAHMGGDDFALLLHPDQAPGVCDAITRDFAHQLPLFYSPEQVRAGAMEVLDRNGNARRVPLLACRIAVVTNRNRKYACLSHMLDDAQALLRQLKAQPGHGAAIDRLPAGETRKAA